MSTTVARTIVARTIVARTITCLFVTSTGTATGGGAGAIAGSAASSVATTSRRSSQVRLLETEAFSPSGAESLSSSTLVLALARARVFCL